MKKVLFALGALVASFTVQAQEYEKYGVDVSVNKPKGINVGDQVVSGLEFTDHKGVNFKLDDMVKSQKVIVQFYRGNWCPVCNKYYENNAKEFKALETKKVKVIIVSPEPMTEIKKMFAEKKFGLSVVSDVDGKIMDAFDVKYNVNQGTKDKLKKYLNLDLNKHNTGKNAKVLPVPATFIVAKDRKVTYKQFDLNYRNRADVAEVAKAL